MKSKKTSTKAVNVGSYVSKEYFEKHSFSFMEKFPDRLSSIIVSKSQIREALNHSPKVKGIWFSYGIKDSLNPNSLKMFLIPCSSESGDSLTVEPIITTQGYQDHLGETHSTLEVCGAIANFAASIKREDSDICYKKIRRGGFYGKNSLLSLINNNEYEHIRIHFGHSDKGIIPIFEPFNSRTNVSSDIYFNISGGCPFDCDPMCVATMAVLKYSSEEELDVYRDFRDNKLLLQPDGGLYYELYYFISPYIRNLILSPKTESAKDRLLTSIYQEKITPFRLLLEEDNDEAAFLHLKDTLNEWLFDYKLKSLVH